MSILVQRYTLMREQWINNKLHSHKMRLHYTGTSGFYRYHFFIVVECINTCRFSKARKNYWERKCDFMIDSIIPLNFKPQILIIPPKWKAPHSSGLWWKIIITLCIDIAIENIFTERRRPFCGFRRNFSLNIWWLLLWNVGHVPLRVGTLLIDPTGVPNFCLL